ncbi:GNAT family N-acetyltransferase [Myxococcus sp. CA051A]|uniref:GNAT family N-acetyltransferase n=1 Tax=unclassified Myxococcus TaxID=2648731 RepID=UPI00157B70DD|nr:MULTISPECIES: GNAT family N-acetyltransferase [unclassified Myxococcus]NTX51369.1 GNAT family N-acetyltransferase [Myxococcus sp. CA039A]NTX66332.1 GNAT family N-acetyltransferase [Myxococcus sp. CA051A]
MPNWQWKAFSELTLDELYDVLALRQEVFIVEQKSLYLDVDGLDRSALHLLAFEDAGPQSFLAAYLRILPPDVKFPGASSLGRVVTSPRARGRGLGRELTARGITRLEALYPDADIRISAQDYLRAFYTSLGFVAEGDIYDEDGIPHVEMVRRPRR